MLEPTVNAFEELNVFLDAAEKRRQSNAARRSSMLAAAPKAAVSGEPVVHHRGLHAY